MALEELAAISRGAFELLSAGFADPASAVHRFGNRLVMRNSDGEERILGFLEQAGPQLDSINDSVGKLNGKLDGLGLTQQNLASSLALVQSLSIISLGFTAIVPVALFAAYSALRRQQKDLQNHLGRLAAKIAAMNTANLETGLEHLRLGFNPHPENQNQSRERLRLAHDRCTDARQYFGTLLVDELQNPSANRAEIRLLARYFTVAARGVASSHIGLEEDETAKNVVQHAESRLREVSQRIFSDTVGKDPIRFLLPPPEEGGVKLAFMVDLYQQAQAAGAVDGKDGVSAQSWFETHRKQLFAARAPRFGSWKSRAEKQHRELAEAIAFIEEVNRLKGLGAMINEVRERDGKTLEMHAKLSEAVAKSPEKAAFFFWSPG